MKAEDCRVLLVDDQEALRLLIRSVCSKMGLQVVGEAADGVRAVELFEELRPDLVLLDINMPRKTGVEVLHELLAVDEQARVVMLTSVAEMDTVRTCVEAGALNYILKTNPVEKIRAAIRDTLADL